MKTHPHNVVRLVDPDDPELDGHELAAWSDDRGKTRRGAGCIGRQGSPNTASHPPPAEAEPPHDRGKLWSVMSALTEGFALYGAALHPAAAMPVHMILTARRDWKPGRETAEPAEPVHSSVRDDAERNTRAVECSCVPPSEAQPGRRWTLLRSTIEMLTVLRLHWRREREIKRAAAALKELDDRTLRDLGVNGRSEIEWAVRYWYDR